MKTAVTETVAESVETAVDTVAEKTSLLTPKNLVVAAGVSLIVVGVIYGVKKFRARQAEETAA